MTRVLVAYASKRGSTAEIAEAIRDELDAQGLAVDCVPASDVRSVADYDAVVVGSAVYMKRWRRDAGRLLRRHSRELAARPLWIFSSGPVGKDPDYSWSEPRRIVETAERLGARGHVVFGGRLPIEPKGFVEKAMVRDTPEELRDARDFDEIRTWAASVAYELGVRVAA